MIFYMCVVQTSPFFEMKEFPNFPIVIFFEYMLNRIIHYDIFYNNYNDSCAPLTLFSIKLIVDFVRQLASVLGCNHGTLNYS